MSGFALTSPKYGAGEHTNKMLLTQAFISRDSRNVRERYGEYRACRGRLAALYDDDSAQIAPPKYVYAITAVTTGTKTFTISGDHAATITANADSTQIRINGSTGNDALYTLVSATKNGANTDIVVSETVSDATVDGNVFVGIAAVLKYHRYVNEATATEYLLLATAYHILLWDNTAKTLTVKFTVTTPGNVERWSMVTHQDCVYASNGDDLVQKWDSHTSVSGSFADLGSASGVLVSTGIYLTKARHVGSIEGYLWLGYTTEDGGVHARRVRYSDANADTFNTDGAGDAGYKDLNDECGFVMGFADIGDYMIIASEYRMTRAWLTTTDTPWYFAVEKVRAGCIASDTLVTDREGHLYWLANDYTIRELNGAMPFSSPHAAKTLKSLNGNAVDLSQAVYYQELDRLLFAVPTADSETNDIIIEIDPYSQAVVFHDIPVSAFGLWTRQTVYTWDTLPYDTYDEWGAAWLVWDAAVNSLGFALVLASNYSGYSYEFDQADNDAGSSMTRELIFDVGLIEPSKHLAMFKRISQGIDLFFNWETDVTIDVYVRRDGEQAWTDLGSATLVGDDATADYVQVHLDADSRAKHFEFKIESTGYFEFIGAYIVDFELDGLR